MDSQRQSNSTIRILLDIGVGMMLTCYIIVIAALVSITINSRGIDYMQHFHGNQLTEGYFSGPWVSAAGVKMFVDLMTPHKVIRVDDNLYAINTVVSYGSGLILTVSKDEVLSKVTLSKHSDIDGAILAAFDDNMETCKSIHRVAPEVPVCVRAFMWDVPR